MDERFESLIRERDRSVSYIIEEITHICRDMRSRSPGSVGEREAAAYMAQILRRDCGCESVQVESFSEHPGGFYGYLYFSAVLDVLCAAGFFLSPWLSLLFGTASLLLMLFQFLLYHEVVDRFFPERESVNVTAIRHCTGEVQRRVFFNGHIDAAWEWPVNYHLGGVAFEAHSVIATAGVLFYLALALCALFGAGGWVHTAALFGLLCLPFWVGLAFLWDRRRVVDGANDNLTGCYIGIALLKALEENGVELEHTEVGVLLTGSEESGLRGAKAWCRTHREAYSDVPTYIYCFDTIHDPRYLMVNERDLNGTVRADAALSGLFLDTAAEMRIPCRRGWVPPLGGATDSAAFTQGGFRSVGITGLNHKLEDYYHTRRDSYDNLNAEGIENCFAVGVGVLSKIDSGMLER